MCVFVFVDQMSIYPVLSMAKSSSASPAASIWHRVRRYRDGIIHEIDDHGSPRVRYRESCDEGIKYQLDVEVKIKKMMPEDESKGKNNRQVSYNNVLPYIAKMVKLQGRPPKKEVAIQELKNHMRETKHPYAGRVFETYIVKKLFKFAEIYLNRPKVASAANKGVLLGTTVNEACGCDKKQHAS